MDGTIDDINKLRRPFITKQCLRACRWHGGRLVMDMRRSLFLNELAALAYYYATVGLVDTLAVEVVHGVVGSGGLDGHIADTGGIGVVMCDDVGDVKSGGVREVVGKFLAGKLQYVDAMLGYLTLLAPCESRLVEVDVHADPLTALEVKHVGDECLTGPVILTLHAHLVVFLSPKVDVQVAVGADIDGRSELHREEVEIVDTEGGTIAALVLADHTLLTPLGLTPVADRSALAIVDDIGKFLLIGGEDYTYLGGVPREGRGSGRGLCGCGQSEDTQGDEREKSGRIFHTDKIYMGFTYVSDLGFA